MPTLVRCRPRSHDRLTARWLTPFDLAGPSGLGHPDAAESEVARLLIQGLSDREIAAALSISERTAGNHVQHIMQKFNVESRTAAALVAGARRLSRTPADLT